jgi:tryptophan-rich sensory protein
MELLIGATPLVTGLLMGSICPTRQRTVPSAQPPSWVFGVVWPLLYIALGVAWVRARRVSNVDALFLLIVGSLLLWQYLFSCRGEQRLALYTLVGSIALVLATALYINRADPLSSALLAPLLAWLVFATMLNYSSVERVYA